MSKIDDLLKTLEKEVGTNATHSFVENFIDTGYPPLNNIICGNNDGGIPYGRITEIFGASSCGKTFVATQLMINAQKKGGIAIFIDWERSFDERLAVKLGLNTERPYWIYLKPETWEEGSILANKAIVAIRDSNVIEENAPIVVVFDSIASAVPQSQLKKNIDEYSMNDTTALARVASTTLKVMTNVADKYNATLVYLNQIRTKPGEIYGPKFTTPGGTAMGFMASVRIYLSRSKITGKEKEFIGQKIDFRVEKTKLTKPFQECSMLLLFDEDGTARFDYVSSLIMFMKEKGILPSSGAYVTWTDGKKYYPSVLSQKIKEEDGYEKLCELLEGKLGEE